ncbi:MAG TPA: ribosome biogenesis GTPase Der [Candidatus Binataceae bacterium]|nr:ribosome biogenesis GTPase Der [Candidatus Binataceae bacterium]
MKRKAARKAPANQGATQRIVGEGLPAIVIAGRANAGKSTLFNRIARGYRAITSAIPGTTRDLNFVRTSHGGRDFMLIDSGGLELGGRERMNERIVGEAMAAIGAADAVVYLLDGRAGLGPADQEALTLVRETGCPLIVAINKLDRPEDEARASEYHAVGAERLHFISAAHGRGIGALLDDAVSRLAPPKGLAPAAPDLKIALVGRPNVGKSSLLNRLCGFERAIVDETPGTTRDPVDVRLSARGREVLLIDTAGIRRPTRVGGELEHHSVGRSIETMRRADVVLLVIDATEGITDQDVRLARLAEASGRALVIVCNKWDAAAKLGRKVPAFVRDTHERYPFLEYAAIVFTSALTGDGVKEIIPAATRAGDCWRETYQTSQLNRILKQAGAAMDPPMVDRRRLNLMYVTQVASAPPRLRFFTNVESGIPAHYVRFLESKFRKSLNLVGSPLWLEFIRTGRSWAQGAPPTRPPESAARKPRRPART